MDKLMDKLQVRTVWARVRGSCKHNKLFDKLRVVRTHITAVGARSDSCWSCRPSAASRGRAAAPPAPASCRRRVATLQPPNPPSSQARLKLKSKGAAFALLVAAVASVCFSALGALFFSRWVQG